LGGYIGIDLGTTFSAVATLDETGRPRIIKSDDKNIIASCVELIAGSELAVGDEVAARLGMKGFNVGARFKRDMGSDVEIELGTGKHTKKFTPTELSAAVLNEMKKIAEEEVGEVIEAVVTVPANFKHDARDATMAAAKMAGLKVKHIINEPTAAALYYGSMEEEDLHGNYVVYDLGGGTFDVSVVKISGKDVDVLASDGVSKLGGDDFDRILQNLIKDKFFKEHGRKLDDFEARLSEIVKHKIDLSRKESVKRQYDSELIEVTRNEFEEAIGGLVEQTKLCCESVLEEAKLSVSDIKSIFLAGGSTRIPCVLKAVEDVFKKKPKALVNVDEVVALGAALYAAMKSDGQGLTATQRGAVNRIGLSEISNYYFGTKAVILNNSRQTEELMNLIIISKGEKIPCSVSQDLFTIADNQTVLNCVVTQSGSPETDLSFVQILKEGTLSLPGGRPQGQKIEVTYSFDENGMMACKFLDVASSEETVLDISPSVEVGDSNIEEFFIE
jgi:molecular chaperone DnaK